MIGKIKRGCLFVISAPSGGGKTTLTELALKDLQKNYSIQRVITFTTRKKRAAEVDGVDYNFVTEEDFRERKAAGFFVEVTEYNGNLYGSPNDYLPLLDQGISLIAITDRNGIMSYKALSDKIVPIWIIPPSLEVLKNRLAAREGHNSGSFAARLALAAEEMKAEAEHPLCRYTILNDNIEAAAQKLAAVIGKCIDEENLT